MTDRERWIVYPLLFLALGVALRDKLSEHTKTKTIECQELIVYGEESAGQPAVPLVQIGGTERTSSGSPHLGQIVVYGVESADQHPKPLVQIGGRDRTSPNAPLLGEAVVSGMVRALGVEAEGLQAAKIYADNYFFRRMSFGPVMPTIPGVSAVDQLRAQQLQQQAEEAAKSKARTPPPAEPTNDKADEPSPPAESPTPPSNSTPPAE